MKNLGTSLLLSALLSAPVLFDLQRFGGGSGSGSSGSSVASGGTTSPAQITSDQDDYAGCLVTTTSQCRVNTDTTVRYIKGLAGGVARATVQLCNTGATTILLPDQGDNQASTTAANRFDFAGNTVPLFPSDCLLVQYDGTSSRWRGLNFNAKVVPPPNQGISVQAVLADLSIIATGYTNVGNVTHAPAILQLVGTSGAASQNPAIGFPGLMQLATGTNAAGSAAWLGPSLMHGNNWYFVYEGTLTVSAVSDGTDTYSVFFGMKSGATDGVWLSYTHSANSGKWVLNCVNNSSATTTNTTSNAIVAGTYQRLKIKVNPAGTLAEAFENGTSIGTCNANIPTSRQSQFRMQILKSLGTTSRAINVPQHSMIGYAPSPR